ncbi:MAG: CHAP domain-containing protein [Daejeonella sp.]
MKGIRNICILIAHLLMLALGANAQGIKPDLTIKAGIAVPSLDPRISRVREIYTSQVGVREKQTNSGPEVDAYLRYVNLPKGNAWCAAFVCWVLGKAGVINPKTGWSPALFPAKRVVWERDVIASAARQWQRAENGKLKAESGSAVNAGQRDHQPISQPRPGDVFGLYFPEKKRIAHVGFVDEWDGTWVVTVEGNTNGEEGSLASLGMTTDGVYRKRRLVRSVYKVARYVD